MPAKAQSADNIEKIFVSSYQNYALASDGTMYTWGLKGFVLGTDSLGRDMLTRIVNGGQVTMTVGAISVVIATILGIIFGGVAGYFGGRIRYPHHAYRGDRRRPAVHPVRDDPLRRHRHEARSDAAHVPDYGRCSAC